ncbi:MAG: exodeoxyribonuclease VII small subunit [Oscillospiraceae bacterium]|nr:exodeoxyribonuclease VII small subunit [Oscillospiraceae bacterium]
MILKQMTYEQAMKRLEEIVKQLENGSLPLEDAMGLFEEGTKLSGFCAERLSVAEQKVTELSQLSSGGSANDL